MRSKFVSHLAGSAKTILWSVLYRAHQDLLHLSRQRWSDLAWSRVLGKIKYQERVVLGVRTGQQVKHCRCETINVRRWLHSSTKKFRWCITHSTNRRDSLLLLRNPPRNTKIDKHNPAGVAIDHQVSGLEITIDDRFGSRV